VVAVLAGDAAASLDELTVQVAAIAGPGHWESGRSGRAHVTIRALEPYSHDPPGSLVMTRSWSAFEGIFVEPLQLALDGLLLAPAGVMLRCRDLDGAGDALRSAYGTALGTDDWFEDQVFARGRDPIWYCTLLHFAGLISDPPGLVEWVEARADRSVGRVSLDTFSLCRWNLDEVGMAPTALHTTTLGAPRT
jgi:hypothetical protein